ncbi:MAG: glycine cleavage system aminomethyltransferase GcvT [bacterium]|nr:glycine cleavage system aminomethyltransferase GcvT [bacterium]
MAQDLLRTPLYEVHKREGGKIVEFAGWEMPVEYAGIKQEHIAVRQKIGLFDLSHMGEIEVIGPDAIGFVNGLVTNDVMRIRESQCMYTCMCRENGGIIDDLIVYRFPDREDGQQYLWMVVNASNCAKDFAWIKAHETEQARVSDLSMQTALLAVQGPDSQKFLQPLTDADLEVLSYYHLTRGQVAGIPAVISRTGYTGEDGFELYVAWQEAEKLWQALREAEGGIEPIGLGARDTLRLEAGYSLYGHEITEETSPVNSTLNWVVSLNTADFIGKAALQAEKEQGIREAIVGLVMQSRAIPRQGYEVEDNEGNVVGHITSGTFSPSLSRGVALARIAKSHSSVGTELKVVVRSRREPALVQKPPFVRGSVRNSR